VVGGTRWDLIARRFLASVSPPVLATPRLETEPCIFRKPQGEHMKALERSTIGTAVFLATIVAADVAIVARGLSASPDVAGQGKCVYWAQGQTIPAGCAGDTEQCNSGGVQWSCCGHYHDALYHKICRTSGVQKIASQTTVAHKRFDFRPCQGTPSNCAADSTSEPCSHSETMCEVSDCPLPP
jgi:hypothetical protein